jgi:hypothetical protein
MTTTRNRNNPGNYQLEQWSIQKCSDIITSSDKSVPAQTQLPGNGLLPGRIGANGLSHNSCDIESMLFGIGSANLVQPLPAIWPQIKPLQSLSIIDRTPFMLPEPLVIAPNQRPQNM